MPWASQSRGIVSDGNGRDAFIVRSGGGFLKDENVPLVFKGAKQDNVSMPKPDNSKTPARYFPSGCGRDAHIHTCGSKAGRETGYGSSNSNFMQDLRVYGKDTEPLPGMNSTNSKRVSRRKKHGQNFAGLNRAISSDEIGFAGSPFAKKQNFNFPPSKQGSSMDRRMDRHLDTIGTLGTSQAVQPYVKKSSPHRSTQKDMKALLSEKDALEKMLADMSEESRIKQLEMDVRALKMEKQKMIARLSFVPS